MPSDVQTLHIPLANGLLEKIDELLVDENKRSPEPISREAYVTGILVNYVFNKLIQGEAQELQRGLADKWRKLNNEYLNTTLQALKKK